MIEITLDGAMGMDVIHDRLAETLHFTAYYGRNLDAMYDVLTEYGSEWRIEFRNSANAPKMFRQACLDAAAATPGLEIVFG